MPDTEGAGMNRAIASHYLGQSRKKAQIVQL